MRESFGRIPHVGQLFVAGILLTGGNITGGETNMAMLITAPMLQPRGQRYEAVVPDTLDLAERAKLSVHGLTSFLNPLDNYSCPIEAYYNMKPAAMAFTLGGMMNGGYNWGKIAQSILLARVMCGSEENLDIEEHSLHGMLAFRPGSSPSPSETMQYACMSRIMLALTTLQQQSPTPALRRKIQDYVQTHIRSAKVENDKAWYYDGPRDTATWGGLLGFWQQTFIHGTALRALSSWNMLDGDADSLTLARQMKNFLCQPKFWAPEAEPKAVISSDRAHFDGHHHSNAATLMGLCWYAGVAHDPRAMEFARSGYEYLRNWGIARIGLFGESCTVGDMTMLAMKLTDLGVGDYWEDVDSYVRNHLTEMQITDAKKMQTVVDQMPPAQGLDPKNTTSDQVVERTVGTYLSDSSHPSLVTQRSFRWTICCSGNCTPALYYAWEGITRYDDATKSAVINLLLNRASAWLDIDSYLPYEGKVVIRNKTARNISVRIPRWADKTAVHALVNGQQAQFRWIGQYLSLDNLAPSAQITIAFPMIKTVEQYTITWTEKDAGGGGQGWFESMNAGSGHETYTCTFKGNTLVDIAPRSSSPGYPLYRRDRERDSDLAPTNKVTRFVSSVLPKM